LFPLLVDAMLTHTNITCNRVNIKKEIRKMQLLSALARSFKTRGHLTRWPLTQS